MKVLIRLANWSAPLLFAQTKKNRDKTNIIQGRQCPINNFFKQNSISDHQKPFINHINTNTSI